MQYPQVLLAILLATTDGIRLIRSQPAGGQTKSAAVRSSNQFAVDLLRSLSSSERKNIFFSPMSISAAIAMTSLGARGDTLKEIDSAFHFDAVKKTSSDPMALHKTFQEMMSLFENQNSNYSLSIANRLFSQQGFEILDQYLKDTDKYYKATVQEVDFGSGQAEGIINSWVAKQTRDKIKQLFGPGSLSGGIVLALVNAIYFKGNWETRFDKESTTDMDFFSSPTETKSVRMMSMEKSFPYTEDQELKIQILELPYDGDDLSMVVILPELGGISNLVSQLTAEKLETLLGQLRTRKVNVKLPKFKLETRYELEETLQKLGVNHIFDNSADLSGISNQKIKVSKVIHKAFVETDEEGTEAAGATGVGFVFLSANPPTEKTAYFTANRSFVFAIIDKRLSNQMLFLGALMKP